MKKLIKALNFALITIGLCLCGIASSLLMAGRTASPVNLASGKQRVLWSSGDRTQWRTYDGLGYSLKYPSGWFADLTRSDPHSVLFTRLTKTPDEARPVVMVAVVPEQDFEPEWVRFARGAAGRRIVKSSGMVYVLLADPFKSTTATSAGGIEAHRQEVLDVFDEMAKTFTIGP